MALVGLIKGFYMGRKYFSSENLKKSSATFENGGVVTDGPMEDYLFEKILAKEVNVGL